MRAQGLPISTIIIAALGILVLVVLGAIFSGQSSKIVRAINECPGRCYVSDTTKQDLKVEAARARISVDVDFLYQVDRDCDPESEARVSGVYFPRNLPKITDPLPWRCRSCCVPI